MRHGDLDREHLASSVAFTRPTGRAYPHGSRKAAEKFYGLLVGRGLMVVQGEAQSNVQSREMCSESMTAAVGRQLLLTCEPFVHRLRRALPARTSTLNSVQK